MCYIVAKDREKQGCFALKSRIGEHLSAYTKSLNESLPRKGIQIIVISRPTAYGEYAPYRFVDNEDEFRKVVMSMWTSQIIVVNNWLEGESVNVQRELKVVFGDDEAGKAQADGFIGIAVSGEK